MEWSEELVITAIAASMSAGIIIFLVCKVRLKELEQNLIHHLENHQRQQSELLREKDDNRDLQERLLQSEKARTELSADFKNVQQRLQEEMGNQVKHAERFENIANKVLRTQTLVFSEHQSRGMKEILHPLQEKITQFESKIESTNKESIERHSSLKEQIRHLGIQSEKVAQDANNLARALKGDYKKQGNWGELILESILDKSGLEKDREYYLQLSERDDRGRIQKPDVVILLPDQKKLIIDSKVSLVAYDRLMSVESESEAGTYLKAHSIAVKKHIDELSARNYHDLYQIDSPDFVLMFIPIDTAFGMALKQDSGLYGYAFDKNIVIVTPSTLLATLKTVETMWRNDKQNRYALEIAHEAGKMYDKFVGFVDDMEKMGNQLTTVQKTYDASMSKLSIGPGNVVKKAEYIKSLGAKANKFLPPGVLQKATSS